MISAAMAQDAAPASAQAAELYQTLLSSVGALVPASDDTSVVAHWPHVGSSYDGLAIVGQALRGWPDEFDPAGFRSAASRTDAMAVIHRRTAGRTEPMDWLATSRVRNSPFWTVARLATEGLTSGGGPWFSRFAWLNLYPLAPELGNPGGWLREAQDPHVGSLLRALINMIRARTVIALVAHGILTVLRRPGASAAAPDPSRCDRRAHVGRGLASRRRQPARLLGTHVCRDADQRVKGVGQ
jgi:hypothetical protein